MTFKEFVESKETGRFWSVKLLHVINYAEEYSKMKAEQSARRAAEYMVENVSYWSTGNVVQPEASEHIESSIQHAISEG